MDEKELKSEIDKLQTKIDVIQTGQTEILVKLARLEEKNSSFDKLITVVIGFLGGIAAIFSKKYF